MLTYDEDYDRVSSKKKPFYIKKKINRLFFSVMGRLLPRKTKRLIFVSTFIACANEVTNPSKLFLTRINELLRISEFDEAIALPMFYGLNFWEAKLPHGIHLQHLRNPVIRINELKNRDLNPAELRITANTILSCSPKWLMYDSKRVMRADIVNMLSTLPKLSGIM